MRKSKAALLSTLLSAALTAACSPQAPDFDLLILNGMVYDGSLSAGRVTNIGITDDRIVSMSAPGSATAKTLVDARE